ncbi:S-layer protein domain-containing protein [Methanolobus halotolerans]|uniref:S-layer protein n=1 Tax=Methanolobus halotolerans TaxID=2052935 RepID=A0A4E0QDQ9_9EURY|nr:S-layer protein domain-containing protein [Methanolobus halotolerans]TGC11521.1 S-layer protein [Methanolobus halotolerans]
MNKDINLVLLVSLLLSIAAMSTTALAQDNTTGNRIWAADSNVSLEYTWTAQSYPGFYYDLDSGEGSETLTVTLQSYSDRSIQEGDLRYSTVPIETDFEHDDWGSYEIIGFMAERYFAGYNGNTTFADDPISLMGNGELSKIVMDTDDELSVFSGSSIILEEGYELNIQEVDLEGNSVLISLERNGDVIETDVVAGNDDYVYETDLGSEEDVPVIIVHFNNIFRGTETNAVFIEGIFQISEEYIEVESGDDFGTMEVETISSDEISMENSGSISLSRGNTVNIMGNLDFVVADDEILRFGPERDISEPVTYELRGTVIEDEAFTWTPLNFAGFYYNIDEGVGTESLEITELNGRSIPDGSLIYRSEPQQVSFEYDDWGTFNVIGFLAEKYFAGYSDDTAFADEDSLLSGGQLSQVLIDSDMETSLFTGSRLVLEEGYELIIEEVDLEGDSVLVSLEKNGDEVDTGIVSGEGDYVYETDVGDTDDLAIITVHFQNIFRGTETNAVFIEGIFQISEDYIEVQSGDSFGELEITSFSASEIVMENDGSVTLSRDNTVDVTEEISFRVADSGTLRYYPFVEVTTEATEPLTINIPRAIEQNDTVTIEVTSRGTSVAEAVVMFGDTNIGETSENGTIEYAPEEAGTFTVTAEKEGFARGSVEVDVISPEDVSRRLAIEVSPESITEGDTINISVVTLINSDPVEGVEVLYDSRSVGTTDEEGVVTYTARDPGMHKLTTSSDEYLSAELNIDVQESQARFAYSDLNIEPLLVQTGEEVTITANVENTGLEAGEEEVELLVNGEVADTENVTIDPGANQSVEFTVVGNETGTYNVSIGTLNGTFDVEEQGIPFPGVAFTLLIIVTVGLWMTRRRT